jgi:hypothetical protein
MGVTRSNLGVRNCRLRGADDINIGGSSALYVKYKRKMVDGETCRKVVQSLIPKVARKQREH